MHIALYCRVSTEEQAKHGESIADQQQALTRWAKQNGHTYEVFADEGYSAHKSYKSRPALSALLESIDNYKLIVFTKFDRWTRKAADYYKLQDILDKHNVAWKAILEDYETVTSDGRFKVGIMLSVNQHEAERTSDRIKFTFAEKRKRGEIISGNMPRGYSLVDGKPVKNEDADGIAAFWETYFIKGMGAAQRAASERGVNIVSSSAAFMLRNAMHYTGQIQGVECEPYITVSQAERIVNSRSSRPKAATRVFMFSGLVVCGECGGRFSGHSKHYKHADGTEAEQVFYNCNQRHRTRPYRCDNKTCFVKSTIERYCLEHLSAVISDYNAEISAVMADEEKARADREKRLKQLENKSQRAYEAYIDGIVSKAEFEQQREKIQADIDAVEPLETKRAPVNLPRGWQEIYKALNVENRRLFWLEYIDKIIINADRSIEIKPR